MTRPTEIEELLAHAGWLRALARNLVHTDAAADDLVQDTWVAALRRPPTRDPRAWLARVVRNLAHNARRATLRRTTREALAHAEPTGEPPDEVLAEAEAQRLLAEAVTRLPQDLRTVVVLRYFRGLDSPAIARELDLSPSAVRTRLQRALEALRRELDDRFGGRRGAWCALFAPFAARASTVGPVAGLALAAAAAMAVVGWLGMRDAGEGEHGPAARAQGLQAGTAASPLSPLPPTTEDSIVAPAAQQARTPRSTPGVPLPSVADIEGRVLLDGAEPGRAIALEVRFLEPRARPPASAPAIQGSGHAAPRGDVRKLLTETNGRFEVFAVEAECGFRLEAPGLLLEAEGDARGLTPARGLVVRLRTPPALSGRVVTAAGEPVRGTLGRCWLQSDFEGWQLFSGPADIDCDEQGRFTVSLLGLLDTDTPESFRAQLLLEVGRVGRLQVDAGLLPWANQDLGTLRLEPARELSFRVRDGRGQPLSGAVARLDDHWLSKPSSPTNGAGLGELRHAPEREVRVRFSAFGCEDQVLAVAPGDEPEVWLAPATRLELQLDRPASLDGPFPTLVLTAREELVTDDAPESPIPRLLEPGWIQAELGATPVLWRDSRSNASGRTFRHAFQPDAGGLARIVGLRPDVLVTVEAWDAAGDVLARGELVLGRGEARQLELRYGE